MFTNKVLAWLSTVCFLAGSALTLFAANDFLFFAQILFAVTLILTTVLVRKGMIRTLDNDTRTFFKNHLLALFSPLIILCLQLILLASQNLLFSGLLCGLYIISLGFVSFMGNREKI